MLVSPNTPYQLGPPNLAPGYIPTLWELMSKAVFVSSFHSDNKAHVTSSDLSFPMSSGRSNDRKKISRSNFVPSDNGNRIVAVIGASHLIGAIDSGNQS